MHISKFLLYIKYDQSYIFISSRYNNIVVSRLDQSTILREQQSKNFISNLILTYTP